ncbi:hypothetical protein [Actinoplanes solisilvae]|uniref:hypothetical protein n=1 Tax=Actinoplanes solisilvae TaxID=2486853 RepID=UPI001F0C6E87|nr:hypothetical protein [Actinoplanes solisilvae]
MDTSGLPEPLRARIAEREARSTIEKARSLLQGYVPDSDGSDEIREELLTTARYNTYFLRQELTALETVLTEDLPNGTLFRMVSIDASWPLDDDPTDAGAAVFLRQFAGWVRAAIDQAENEKRH